jgi:hypothetical protein
MAQEPLMTARLPEADAKGLGSSRRIHMRSPAAVERRGARVFAVTALSTLLAACAPAPEVAEVSEGPEVPHVRVVGLDYTFALADTLPAGPVRIDFENRGEVPHEMILVRLRPDVSFPEMMEGMQAGGDPAEFVDGMGGILIANPGETTWGHLRVDLETGRTYALVCNFTDSADAPPHAALGMVLPFTVR